jgi:hypothetical protein
VALAVVAVVALAVVTAVVVAVVAVVVAPPWQAVRQVASSTAVEERARHAQAALLLSGYAAMSRRPSFTGTVHFLNHDRVLDPDYGIRPSCYDMRPS